MSTVCAGVGGRLIKLEVGGDTVAPLDIDLGGVDISEFGVAVGLEMSQEVQAQFQPSLDDAIYITPFGDSPGNIAITFVANRECGEDAESTNKFITTYLNQRMRPDNAQALVVSVGGNAFYAFVTGMRLNASTADTPVVQGTLILTAWSSEG